MLDGRDGGGVRIAELVATLSYAADLGLGQPMDHCMRQTVIALRLAELIGADDGQLEATYYLGLVMNAYCHADAAEQAKWFGDDIAFKRDGFEVLGMNTAQAIAFFVGRLGSHGRPTQRAKRMAIFPVSGLLAMGAALRSVYGEIRKNGSTKGWGGELYPFDEFSRLMGFERIWAFEREHAEL